MSFKRIFDISGADVPPPFARHIKKVLAPEDEPDVEGFTLLTSTLASREGKTNPHTHESQGELMYIVTGRGEGYCGDEKFKIEPDCVLWAPPGAEHQLCNTSEETMRIFCVFIPALPAGYADKAIEAAKAASKK